MYDTVLLSQDADSFLPLINLILPEVDIVTTNLPSICSEVEEILESLMLKIYG